jgi:carbonic anhydrase/acetyltransferase-like protein (isoleucine patch superfamily)
LLEILLTREDANTELALLSEWLVEDRAEVTSGQPVCVVETTKATVEVESPGDGTLVQLFDDGTEVELGKTIALVAETPEEVEAALARRESKPAPEPATGDRKATKKAIELAERHAIALASIEKRGFITEKDVQLAIDRRRAAETEIVEPALAGVSSQGVTLPSTFQPESSSGALEPSYYELLQREHDAFRALPPEEKVQRLREHGAVVGEGVELGAGSLVLAPRIVLADGVRLESGATVVCEEAVVIGAATRFGPGLELRCRRAFLGSEIWGGRSVRFGGGGHREPWATLVVGDLAFVGDEAYVNVCRPVLIGREVFLTMRSLIVTHNIGHSLLEGFENRFAPVVLEDRSQVGLGAVVYAGVRIGAEAIVASSSYVVSDVPAGSFAIGVPAKVSGRAKHELSRTRQVELARRMIDDLHELLALGGHEVSAVEDGAFTLTSDEGAVRIAFTPESSPESLPAGPAVVLALEHEGGVPEGVAVLELLARRVHGSGGIVLDSAREFCRKRGIRFEPGPWRYRGGLV